MGNRKAGIILSYTNTLLNMATGLFLSAFLLRMLGDAEYGLYQTMSSFANYLVLLEFGTGTVMARNLSVCRSKENSEAEINKNIATIWTETLILIAVIIGVATVFFLSIDNIYSKSLTADQIQRGKIIFIIVTLYLIFSFGVQTLGGIILAFERYTYNSMLAIARQIIRVLLLVFLIARWRYALIIAVVDFFLGFAMLLTGYIYCKRKFYVKFSPKYFDKTIFKASLPLSVAIFTQGLANQANSNVGKFLIGIEFSPETVAVYSVALYIIHIFASLGTVPIIMYTPQVTQNVTTGTKGRELTDTIIEPCRLVTIICGTILFGFISVGRPFVRLIYGSEYLAVWSVVLVVATPTVILLTNGVMENVLNAMNKTKPRTFSLLITTLSNILLTILFMKKWGIMGAAIASAVSTFFFQITLLNIYYSKCLHMNMTYLYKKAYQGIVPFQILGTIAAFAVTYFISNHILQFLLGGITYVAISFAGILIFGVNATERMMLKSIISKLKCVKRSYKNDEP